MRYKSQSVALWYIYAALALFAVQVSMGLLIGWIYVSPEFLSDILPFHILRMIHTNSLIVWLLLGFFAAAYYLIPEESERELYSPKLAYIQLGILLVGTLGAVVSYLFGIHGGREFLEQPLWVKLGILVAALIFLFNISMTVLAGRKTAITSVLLLGLWLLSLLWIFAFINPHNLTLDKMYWWFVVHLWVEATWMLVLAAILAYLLLKLTGVDREVVEKWLYVIAGLALVSGILGTGHHYYYIGLPSYWLWIGSVFSTLEVAPLFAMVCFAFIMVWKGKRKHPNNAALLWTLGSAVLAFFGAGVWGFLHTLHGVNFYTHGTQITAAHGHLAFFGAYVAINLAIFTYIMPMLKGREPYNQVLNMASFWLMSGGMVFMTVTLTFAGAIQVHMQRVLGDYYMQVQEDLAIFYIMRFGAGTAVVVGALLFIYALLVPKREVVAPGPKISEQMHEGQT